MYDSESAALLFEQGERLGIKTTDLTRHYDEYQNNIDLLESKPTPKKPAGSRTIKDVRRWKYDGDWERR